MTETDLARELQRQSVIIDLVSALKVSPIQRARIGDVLHNRNISELVSGQDIAKIKDSLSGKRVQLTPRQRELAVVVEHLADYEAAVGPWVSGFSQGNPAYAIEHVLMHYDALQRQFGEKGTGANLIKTLSHADLQVLRKYSGYAEAIYNIYRMAAAQGPLDLTSDADAAAKSLVGKTIVLPIKEGKQIKQVNVRLIETEGYETDEEVTRQRYCMLAQPGEFRMMPFRGLDLVNIGTLASGKPSCVMIRTIAYGDKFIDGPGRIGKLVDIQSLDGKILRNDEITGNTALSGFMPGTADYSKGRYRMQEPLF